MAFPYYPHVPGTGVPCGPCGSPGNLFPYTVQHDANLNFICETVAKAMQEQLKTNEAFQTLDADFGKLVDYVNNYFNNVAIPEEVGKWMDNYVATGEMAKLVHDAVGEYGYSFPTDYDITTITTNMLMNAARWLLCDVNSHCYINATTTPQLRCVFMYSQTKNYRGYASNERSFVGTDKTPVNGSNTPVVYLDCSSFVNLCTRSIRPLDSLNAYCIQSGLEPVPNDISDEPYISMILENPADNGTLDFLGRSNTYNMAKLMDFSGTPLQQIAYAAPGDQPMWHPQLQTIKPGYILFKGDTSHHVYRGISHCGIFIKSLTDLPQYAAEWKTYNNQESSRGYVIECTGKTDGPYSDVLRIATIESWLLDVKHDTTIWAAAPRTNYMLSNKIQKYFTKRILCDDRVYYINDNAKIIGQRNNETLDEYFGNVRIKGLTIPSTGIDIDQVDYGTWQATLHDTINACTGHWPGGWSMASAESIVIQQTGGAASGYGRLQLLWANFGASDTRMAFRMRTPGDRWSDWSIIVTE